MKRAAALRALSREHHGALVLAKRCLGAEGAAAARLAADLPAVFARELKPHFLAEERELLPRLAHMGAHDLVERVLGEHSALHAVMQRAAQYDAGALAEFGRLLEAHVRFEERELFVAAEALLDTDWLAHEP